MSRIDLLLDNREDFDGNPPVPTWTGYFFSNSGMVKTAVQFAGPSGALGEAMGAQTTGKLSFGFLIQKVTNRRTEGPADE